MRRVLDFLPLCFKFQDLSDLEMKIERLCNVAKVLLQDRGEEFRTRDVGYPGGF